MGNRSKDENAATSSEARDQESRDTTLAKTITAAVAGVLAQQKTEETQSITEAVAQQTKSIADVFQRQMEETCAQYEELLKASHAQNFTSTLKVTSSTDGFRVMDPFDWTADKNIYQRWQLWSHKARLALDAMEGDNEKTKISYLHHWLDGKGIDKIKGWMNSKILITQAEYDALQERDRKGRYSSEKIETYFSLVENILTPRSNPLLAVEELHLAKQGSMTSQEFYSQILEIVKRCHFPNQAAEDRAIRDAIFIGMNSQWAKDKVINFMNEEEGKEVTVEFLLNHLAVEDGNSQHRFLSQLDSSTSVNMVAYESRDTTLAKTITAAVAGVLAQQKTEETQSITEAVAQQTKSIADVFQRQMEETCAQYEELLKASHAQNFTSTLKVTSSTDGFRVMDPFDWTADKNIYQRWQLWSHKARLALDAMEGDNEKTKISYLHHWLDGKGIDKIKGWMNSKILITQAEYDALQERDRKGRYSSEKIETYFSLVENILTPRSNPLLAVEELHLAKQGSMTSQEFYSQILEIVKRCHFPNQAAEDRAIRDAIFIGMNSQWAKDKVINFMNEEEGKEVTVEFLLNHLAVEDGNSQHRFLSQLDSSTSVNMVAYDRRQNKGKSNRSRNNNGRERGQNKSRGQTSSPTAQTSRKPPGMEGKCMRCGRPEHQQGEKCAARHAKCKDCHKIGHFYKVCQSSKRTVKANLAQVTPQDENDTHIDECGYVQHNPPAINMLKVTNHTGTPSGKQFLKFPIDVNPRGTYKHHLEVSIDTGAGVNCMNEKTFKKLFPEVELSVCPHRIQNFGNSTADVYILGQFRVYLRFRGRKYLNTFIVTNANDCPNILSHGAIFRMGILAPNYPEENMVKSRDMETGTSNVFQILQDLRMKQYQGNSEPKAH